MHTIGGLVPLLSYLKNPHASLRARAAEVVSTIVQNNPKSQQLVMEANGLENFISDSDITVRTKALGAISCKFDADIFMIFSDDLKHVIIMWCKFWQIFIIILWMILGVFLIYISNKAVPRLQKPNRWMNRSTLRTGTGKKPDHKTGPPKIHKIFKI